MSETPPIIRLPLYRQVMKALQGRVEKKQPGDRLGTESEFVKEYAVSLVTVRQALKELEKEGVIERRQGSGTFVAEASAPQRHVGIFLDVDPTHPLLSPFFLKLAQEIRRVFNEYQIPSRTYYGFAGPAYIKDGVLSSEEVLEDARWNRLKGLICFYTKRHESWYPLLQSKNIPVLDTQYYWDRGWYSKSSFLRKALAHFQQRGRRKLAVLAWENPVLQVKPFQEEIRALAPQYGIELDEQLLDITAHTWEMGMGWEHFRDLWLRRDAHKPDSLIILDDMLFSDCQKAIEELRIRVPDDLDILVKSSDAMNLNARFPVHVYRVSAQISARKFADTMRAMLNGDTPSDSKPSYEIQLEEPCPFSSTRPSSSHATLHTHTIL